MSFVQPDSTFLIPLSRPEGALGVLPDFVGDENNQTLKYFLKPSNTDGHDWPLVLFGPTGTGKTGLAHSLVNLDPTLNSGRPIFQTFVDFSRLFQSAVDTDSTQEFRQKYLKSDLIVLDDLQEFVRFPKAQQEMVNLLDQLHHSGSPLVVTSNQPVQLINGLLPQLVSRLLHGLSIELKPPGPHARRVIIDRLANLHGAPLATDALDVLVDRLPLTFPKINQFFIQYLTSCNRQPDAVISREDLLAYFNQLNSKDQEKIVDLIIRSVANEFKLSPADIRGSSRKQTTALARAISIYLHRTLLLMSFAKIGSYYGNRDHSTVMHAYRKVLDLLGDDRNDNIPRARTLKLESQLHEILAVNI